MTLPQHNSPIDDYNDKVAQGRVPGVRALLKFGRSTFINATDSIIWDHGGNYTFLETAENISVVSTHAADNPLGLGAHDLFMHGLNANYDTITELISLNGLTPVVTNNKFIRLNRMFVINSGTNDAMNDANLGTLTATAPGVGAIQAEIHPHNGQTLMLIYTVPRGYSARAVTIQGSAGQGKSALIKAKVRNGPSPNNAFSIKFLADIYQNSFFYDLKVSTIFPEMTDIVFTAISSAVGVDVAISLGMHIIDQRIIDCNPA